MPVVWSSLCLVVQLCFGGRGGGEAPQPSCRSSETRADYLEKPGVGELMCPVRTAAGVRVGCGLRPAICRAVADNRERELKSSVQLGEGAIKSRVVFFDTVRLMDAFAGLGLKLQSP